MTPATQTTTLRQLISSDYVKRQLAAALPKHMTADRFVRVALTAMMRQPKLLECTQESFMQSCLTLSQWGLEPDGRRAHLVSFFNGRLKRYECQAIPDYKGLAELVMDSGIVTSIHSDLVCDNDVFRYNRGYIEEHVIDLRKPRGEWYAAYALIRMKDGGEKTEVMSRDEILAIRDNAQGYRAYKDGKVASNPWATSEGEMAKKTVFKRATKWVRLGERAQAAVEHDDRIESPVLPAIEVGPATEAVTQIEQEQEQEQEPEKPKRGRKPKSEATTEAEEGEVLVGQTPQATLGALLEKEGFTFDAFAALAAKEGWLDDDAATCFDELPRELCVRMMRAQAGLLAGLAQAKGGQ